MLFSVSAYVLNPAAMETPILLLSPPFCVNKTEMGDNDGIGNMALELFKEIFKHKSCKLIDNAIVFNLLLGKQSSSACVSCDAGYYCLHEGNSTITGQCSPGYYCIGGSSVATPTGRKSYILAFQIYSVMFLFLLFMILLYVIFFFFSYTFNNIYGCVIFTKL